MRSKLSAAAVTVCIVALAASTFMGVTYSGQGPQKDGLTAELAAAEQSLQERIERVEAQAAKETQRLQQQLAAAEADLEKEQDALADARAALKETYSPDMLSTGGVLRGVFELADENGVSIVTVSIESQGEEKRGDLTLCSLSIDLRVAGRLPNIAAFVNKLEKGPVKAVIIDDISITGSGNSHTAELNLSVLYPRL